MTLFLTLNVNLKIKVLILRSKEFFSNKMYKTFSSHCILNYIMWKKCLKCGNFTY